LAKFQTTIDLPVVADARDFIEEVLRRKDSIEPADRSAWKAKCEGWRTRYPLNREYPSVPDGTLSMYRFAETLSDSMRESDVVASGSSGFAAEIFLLVVQAHKNQRVFHSRGMGAMGFGLPASIGACFGSGRRRTICVDGDGGFQMNVQELATIAQHRLPIKLFVINNHGYSSIRSSQSNYFKLCVGCDENSGLTLPSAAAVARAYGLPATTLDGNEDLRAGIQKVLESDGPMVCEVMVAADEPRVPRLASFQRADGAMVSRPLEDLFPFMDRDEFRENMIVAPVGE